MPTKTARPIGKAAKTPSSSQRPRASSGLSPQATPPVDAGPLNLPIADSQGAPPPPVLAAPETPHLYDRGNEPGVMFQGSAFFDAMLISRRVIREVPVNPPTPLSDAK